MRYVLSRWIAVGLVFFSCLSLSCARDKANSDSHDKTPASTGSAVKILPEYFGMHVQCVVTPCRGGVRYPYPAGLGFASVRLWDTAAWSQIEPRKDQFQWGTLDELARQSSTNGVSSFIFTLGNVPAWASSNADGDCGASGKGQCYAPDLASLDSFLTALVQRECGIVTYYEAWNEANQRDFWRGSDSQLLAVTQHFYAIVRDQRNCGCSQGKCSPGGGPNPNRVLTPAANTISGSSAKRWLEKWISLLQQSGLHADVVSFHGYESQPETIGADVAWLRRVADAHGLSKAEIWDTEASWGTRESVDQERDAGWLMRSYVMQAATGVARFYWYAFGSCQWGTLYGPACGKAGDREAGMRQAGVAYGTVSKWLTGATLTGCVEGSDKTWSCSLTRPAGYKAVVLWNVAGPRQVAHPESGLVQGRDWQNVKTPATRSVTVSAVPILLESGTAF